MKERIWRDWKTSISVAYPLWMPKWNNGWVLNYMEEKLRWCNNINLVIIWEETLNTLSKSIIANMTYLICNWKNPNGRRNRIEQILINQLFSLINHPPFSILFLNIMKILVAIILKPLTNHYILILKFYLLITIIINFHLKIHLLFKKSV
jgi:hypothetical protein